MSGVESGGGSYDSSEQPAPGASYEQVGSPAYDGPRQPRSKAPWLVGGAVGALVVLALVLAFVLGGGGQGKPEATVTKAFDAITSGDCDQFTSTLAAGPLRDNFDCDVFESAAKLAQVLDLEVVSTRIDGDDATVEAETSGTIAGQTQTQRCTYRLDRQDDVWLIEGFSCR